MAARVLIVEDNEDLLDNLAEILQSAGHHVQTAPESVSAVRLAASYAFEAALIDYRLPGMDGLALRDVLGRVRPAATYLLMRAYADVAVERAAREGLFRAVFAKPLPIGRVLDLLADSAS